MDALPLMMLSEISQWHITMPVGGGIHAINKAPRRRSYNVFSKSMIGEACDNLLKKGEAYQITILCNEVLLFSS
jgi:hypothetical protein